jgi:GNAT superfamily N-acetyltransferase
MRTPGALVPRFVERPADVRAAQELAGRLWPQGAHPGGLGWALAQRQAADEFVLFEGANGPVALVARRVDASPYAMALVDPAVPEAAKVVVTWLRGGGTRPELTIELPTGDQAMVTAIREEGFEVRLKASIAGMRRSATNGAFPIPKGYVVRTVRPEETMARVDVHRAAWRPASLPYAPHHRPTAALDATSTFDRAAYEAVRRTWLYDPSLDLVVEAPDGSLAACCIAWFHPASGVAEIEPLGVVPQHRGRGLAGALCLAVGMRVVRLGGKEVFINTGPRADYPAPGRAYAKAGFETFVRAHTYRVF